MFTNYRGRYVLFALLILLLVIPTNGFCQSKGFSVRIDKVLTNQFPKIELQVSVLDSQGFPVPDLSADAFKLKEDEKEITNFSLSSYQNVKEPIAVVLLLDTSGSMKATGNQTPLADSIAAASAFVSHLNTDDYVGIINFADSVTVQQDLTSDKSKIPEILSSLKADGATAMNDAIITAIQMLSNRSERRAIVLLTDGEPIGDQQYDFTTALSIASAKTIPIYPIGFGDINKEQLNKLAEMTGGIAQFQPDSEQLNQAFSSILNLFRQKYILEYQTSLPADGASHQVGVELTYQGESKSHSSNFIARQPIEISFPELVDGSYLVDNQEITINVDGLNPIDKVEAFLDDQLLVAFKNPPYVIDLDTKQFSTGNHVLRVTADDALGMHSVKSIKVIIELQKKGWIFWFIGLVSVSAVAVFVALGLRRKKRIPKIAQRALLVEIEGIQPGKVWNLDQPVTRLGRKSVDNEINLKGLGASRSHAVIERSQRGYVIRAVKEENPVLVNGITVREKILKDNEVIQLGESKFRFEYEK